MTAAWLAAELVQAADRDAAPGTPLRLAASRCSACDRCSFPATGTCTWCGAAGADPQPLSDGTAVAATAVLHRTPGAVVAVPYVVALVRFARAGLDVLGRVPGATDPAAVPPGTPLRVVAESLSDGRLHFAFEVGAHVPPQ
jgi:uncharacterized OB-fold protein